LRKKIEGLSGRFAADPGSLEKLDDLIKALRIIKQMPFVVNLWSAQNHVYAIQNGLYLRTKRKAQRGDTKAREWVEAYLSVSDLLALQVQ
jgi:hypothetical protein